MSLTKDQAIAIAESRVWEGWTFEERVRFQLFEDLLCMPFSVFHEAIEKELGRPVWTHEFAFVEGLRDEWAGKRGKPTMDEIIALIPPEKLIIVKTVETDGGEGA